MTLSEGIVKINSRILDSTELKKYDKLEKEGISVCGYTNKGKKDIHDFSTVFFSWGAAHVGHGVYLFLFIFSVQKCLKDKYEYFCPEKIPNFL